MDNRHTEILECFISKPRLALVAQRIEHLTTDQKVRGSNPFGRTVKTDLGDPKLRKVVFFLLLETLFLDIFQLFPRKLKSLR